MAQEKEQEPVTPDWNTPKKFDKVAPHPRLYVTPESLKRAVEGRGEDYAALYEQIERAAETGVAEADNPMADLGDMQKQILMPGRLSAMALQYHRTKDPKYIEASVKTIENMKDWMAPNRLWQLWHGGFSTAVAINYDLLHNDMTPEQRERVVTVARDYFIRPFLQRTARGKNMREHGEHGSWWQGIISNWNPVCNSGAGLLALAMYDDLDEAQTVIDRVDASFDPIIDELQVTKGGWVEGLGYWNWTIHYMALFYMSYENTTGEKHEGFRSPGFGETLTFVDHFVPYDVALGFGDNQHGNVSNSLYAAAEHLENEKALRALQYFKKRHDAARAKEKADQPAKKSDTKKSDKPYNIGYGTANTVLMHPDSIIGDKPDKTTKNLIHTYPKQGWGAMADQWPKPNAYVAFRGGQLGGAHTQDDLLSWHGVIGDEVMIRNIYSGHVSQNSYGSRRNDNYEISSSSKNSLFVGGLGPVGGRGQPAKAKTTTYVLPTGPMAVLEATRAMNTTRNRPRFVARAFLIINDKGLLVLDRVIAPSGGGQPVEARGFTTQKATFGDSDVLLESDSETARMTFASNVDATLSEAVALLTFPKANPPKMIRWQTNSKEKSTVLASLLTRGADPVEVTIDIEQVPAEEEGKTQDGTITVTLKGNNWSEIIKLSSKLEPLEAKMVETSE